MKNKFNKNRAFVLLFSLLISSILLATGLGISRLMIRQISLASLSRESQVALFAADSGLECALHWDTFGRFDPATPLTLNQTIYCNGAIIKDGFQADPQGITGAQNQVACDPSAQPEPPDKSIINGGDRSCFTFALANNSACVFVTVDKSNIASGFTTITSNGYNRCNMNAPNLLQRTLEITLLNE
ncbi:MAG: hypothetical protein Q7S19_02805 [bacterium]|nr:hypothetical protein [bacterium]